MPWAITLRMTYHVCFDCVNALLTITICANIFVKLYLTMLKKQKIIIPCLTKIWRRFGEDSKKVEIDSNFCSGKFGKGKVPPTSTPNCVFIFSGISSKAA